MRQLNGHPLLSLNRCDRPGAALLCGKRERERERERERDEINKNLTCFVGAHTGQSVSGDSAGLWPFLGAAHKTFTGGEA